MYVGQVNRLGDDLAKLRRQLADKRSDLAKATGKAGRAREAAGRASSPSQLRIRTSDLERADTSAARLETQCADLEKKVVTKAKALTAAQSNLDRAQRSQQQKDDRETAKRKRDDLEHLKALERARRPSVSLPQFAFRQELPAPAPTAPFSQSFDVCLSFAGEQRDYVERIAVDLKAAGLSVFYDKDDDIAVELWGRDLADALDWVYRKGSRFCLMFISADYAAKSWTTHERRSALARSVADGGGYVLPARFDDTELPGFQPTIGYLDLRKVAPATLMEFVIQRLAGTDDPTDAEA